MQNESRLPTTTQESLDFIQSVKQPIQWNYGASKSNPARFWNNKRLDALILSTPDHTGRPEDLAREVYHRLVARMVASESHRVQRRAVYIAAFIYTVGCFLSTAAGLTSLLPILNIPGWMSTSAYFATPALLFLAAYYTWENAPRWMCDSAKLDAFHQEAKGAVQRCFLRTLPKPTQDDPAPTPADLADVWRHGWLTSEGRPVSSEIVETDATSLIALSAASEWRSVMLMMLSLAGLSLIAPCMLCIAPLIAFGLLRGKSNPGHQRALEIDRRQGVEGALLVAAGGKDWADRQEQARIAQIMEGRQDKSPILRFGTSTGILAGRGDMFAPSAGLPLDLSLRDLQSHLLVLGGTGSGKTSGVLRPLAHQVAQLSSVGLVVMDGKSALPDELRGLPGMQIVDPAASKFSLVAGLTPTELVDTLADVLRSETENDPFWSESAMGLLRRAAVIAQHAGGSWWTLTGIMQIAATDEALNEAKKRFGIQAMKDDPLLEEALFYFGFEWKSMDSKTKSGILSHARAWISTVTAHPHLLGWANTEDSGDSFDLMAPLAGGRLGFLIPAHRYGRAGAAVTALLKARLYAGLKQRAEGGMKPGETPVVFLIDEAQEVATRDDATMLSIGRSLGLAMVAATQTVEGVRDKLGPQGADKWLAVFGNAMSLQGRSRATDEFMANRAASIWKATVNGVPGISVKDAITAAVFSGSVAVSRRQPSMRPFATPAPSPIAPLLEKSRTAAAQSEGKVSLSPDARYNRESDEGVTSGLRPAPLVYTDEMPTLLAEPNLALALFTRARVPRRDVIKLKPMFPN